MSTSPLRNALVAHLGQVLTPEVAAQIEIAAARVALEKIGIKFHGGDEQSGHVFAVETTAQGGQVLESHTHEHSHMSLLASGVADVTIAGIKTRHVAPSLLTVPMGTAHTVEAITDVSWFCLWADNLAPKAQAEESLRLCTS